MSRITPWDLAFAGEIEQRFPGVQSEATATMKNANDFAQFISIASVQRIIDSIESPEVLKENPAAAVEYHTLLYVVFRYWSAGKLVLPIAGDFLREADHAAGTCVTPTPVPGGACYLQFPERRIWAQVDSKGPHEPIDGLFVTESEDRKQLTTVGVLGLRPERTGFSQISATVALDELTAVRDAVRTPLFDPVMDGGTSAGFNSVTSVAELLLLTQLALAEADS